MLFIIPSQAKRPRGTQEMFQPVPSESGVDVEYQVPTSSQRDHEDEVIVVDSEEDDEDGIADEGVSKETQFLNCPFGFQIIVSSY
jgi:hypothetical protein